MATKVSLFIANYGRKLRIKVDIRRKEKIDNRICRKNKEDLERSGSNIKKSTKRDKITNE